MNTENTIIDHLDKLSPEAMVIANHDVSKEHGKLVYTNMVKQADEHVKESGFMDRDLQAVSYEDYMSTLEEAILALRNRIRIRIY